MLDLRRNSQHLQHWHAALHLKPRNLGGEHKWPDPPPHQSRVLQPNGLRARITQIECKRISLLESDR